MMAATPPAPTRGSLANSVAVAVLRLIVLVWPGVLWTGGDLPAAFDVEDDV
jgi:hypothetical protein